MSTFIGPLDWSKKQGYILTGGGVLNEQMIPGRDFQEEDLPHYHLSKRTSYEAFDSWLSANRRSVQIVGLWSRPLFAGGWAESTAVDTTAYNMQTPSIFIDLRFPVNRPSYFKNKSSLADFSLDELKVLARQHCFSGYSLPEPCQLQNVFTRHHIIDWNFHPNFPRPRPNRWRVELKEDATSFKEHSVAVDEFGVPVYFERWARIPGDSNGRNYFAARRARLLDRSMKRNEFRDGVIIVMGGHFTLAIDRLHPFPEFAGCTGASGGPALVDFAAETGDRAAIEAYLDIHGSYGRVFNDANYDRKGVGSSSRGERTTTGSTWNIEHCTHPWLEGQSPIDIFGPVKFKCDRMRKLNAKTKGSMPVKMIWAGYEWDVMECSFTPAELRRIFNSDDDDEGLAGGLVSRL